MRHLIFKALLGLSAAIAPASAQAGKTGFTLCQAKAGKKGAERLFLSGTFQTHWTDDGWESDENDTLQGFAAMEGIHLSDPQDELREAFAKFVEANHHVKLDRTEDDLRCDTDDNRYYIDSSWRNARTEAVEDGATPIRVAWPPRTSIYAPAPDQAIGFQDTAPRRLARELLEQTLRTYWDYDDAHAYMTPALKPGVDAHRAADKPVIEKFGSFETVEFLREQDGAFVFTARYSKATVEWTVRHDGRLLTSIYFRKTS